MPPPNYHNADPLHANADTLGKSPTGYPRNGGSWGHALSVMGASEDEDQILVEILSHAAAIAGGGRGDESLGRRTSGVGDDETGRLEGGERAALNAPLVNVLQSYEAVLRSRGMVPSEDTFYYRCVLPAATRCPFWCYWVW